MKTGAFMKISASALFLSGCSVNGFGTVDYDVYESDGAIIERLEAAGFHLDTQRDTFSLSLGWYASTRIFEKDCLGQAPSLRDLPPELSFRTLHGVGMFANATELEFALGISERFRLRPIDGQTSGFRKIAFAPENPNQTKFETNEEHNCGRRF